MLKKINIIQVNLGKDKKATVRLGNYINLTSTHLVSINEPYYYYHKTNNKYQLGFINDKYNIIYNESSTKVPKAAIMIRKEYNYLVEREYTNELCVVIIVNNIVIVSYYCEPQTKEQDKRIDKNIEIDLQHLQLITNKHNNKKMIILLDSNAKHTCWGNRTDQQDDRGRSMYEFIIQNQLDLLNNINLGPTFKKEAIEQNTNRVHTRESHIDLTLINHKLQAENFNWKLREDILYTDHLMIEIEMNESLKPKAYLVTKIDYKATEWEKFHRVLSDQLPQMFENTEYTIQQHDEAMMKAMKLVKTKKKKIYGNLPWYSKEIENLDKQVTKVRRKRSGRNSEFKFNQLTIKLKELNNQFKYQLRTAIKEFMIKVHRVNSIDEYWMLWKKTKFKQSEHVPIFKSNKTATIEENVQILADQFIKKPKNKYQHKKIKMNKEIPPTDKTELSYIIKRLSNRKTPGPDQMPNKLIKMIFKEHETYLIDLFNMLLKNAYLPKSWKESRMIFFPKPNKKNNEPSDFRPICLLNGFMKIAEVLFANRLEIELNRINYFVKNQHGFKKNQSTETAIENVINNIKKAKKYQYAIMIALDFSSAFDALSWNMIMNNLIKVNLDNSLLKIAQSLFEERTIYLENTKKTAEIGTPQGGCASPLLFKIGINSLIKELNKNQKSSTTAYADDTSLIIFSNTKREVDETLKEQMNRIIKWCKQAEIGLNKKKTEVMSIGKKKIEEIEIENEKVSCKDQMKYLGIIIDSRLLWNKQIEYLNTKTDQLIIRIRGMCWRNQDLTLSQKMNLYKSVFLPIITYCSNIWYEMIRDKVTYLEKINKLQRKIIRIITGAYKNTNSRKLLEITNTVELTDELEIRRKLKDREKDQRKNEMKELREKVIADRERMINSNLNFQEIKRRETIWFLTETGPLNNYLNKYNIVDSPICRLCNIENETATHLVNDCNGLISPKPTISDSTRTVENKIVNIIKELTNYKHINN